MIDRKLVTSANRQTRISLKLTTFATTSQILDSLEESRIGYGTLVESAVITETVVTRYNARDTYCYDCKKAFSPRRRVCPCKD